MLNQLEVCGLGDPAGFARQMRPVAAIYPWLALVPGPQARDATVVVTSSRWQAADFDPTTLDAEVARTLASHGALTLRLIHDDKAGPASRAPVDVDGWPPLVRIALELVTRYQRLLPGRNRHSADPLFDRALGLHRALHDRQKPLVAADHDHALDVWRWTLRLCPEASLAVQLGALYHDIERLDSESLVRIEQHARNYRAFKETHAKKGAQITRAQLTAIGAEARLVDEVADLVTNHEHPGADPDKQLLNVADALSFFSLNACGFLAYYGLRHSKRKIAYTLARLDARGWRELGRVRHRADVWQLIAEAMARDPGAQADRTAIGLPAHATEAQP
jgi:hypothetical protein